MKQGYLNSLILAILLLLPLSGRAKVNKGTIFIEVGEEYYVDVSYGNYVTQSGYWQKSNSTFIFASQGQRSCKIRGNKVGTGTLEYWGFVNADVVEYYWTVNVQPKSKKVTDIALNKSSLTLVVGGQEQLVETVLPANATNTNVAWESSNENVATVSWGLLTGKSTGTATITCKALDGSGVKATCYVTVISDYMAAEIDETNFPDENFRNYLLAKDYGEDGKLMASEISKITVINVGKKEITDLKGIEFFVALNSLYCYSNKLTSLDVSKCTALKYLQCYRNQLTSLDVSNNTFLINLKCEYNQLTSLDVTKNTALVILTCDQNQITDLDVSYNSELKEFWCAGNQLSLLDMTNNTKLEKFYCYKNQLTYLDVSSNTSLTDLSCGDNELTILDVSRNTALTDLSCYGNQLTELDLSMNILLDELECSKNKLTTLDVSKNTNLKYISCESNQIRGKEMDNLISCLPENGENDNTFHLVSRVREGNVCTKVQAAAAKTKGWTPLWYNTSGSWVEYEGSDNEDEGKEINAANFPDENFRNCLLELEWYGIDGYLTPTDIEGITYLNLNNKNIASLKGIECLTALTSLNCNNNQLTSLDVSNNKALTSLDCGGNQLSELDVSNNIALTSLSCGENKINNSAMDALINSLPQNTTDKNYSFYVIDDTRNKEENVCTKSQVAAAKAKGWVSWECLSRSENSTSWRGYEGSEPLGNVVQGDANGDDTINAADIVEIVNYIMGTSSDKFKMEGADANGDGTVNAADIVAIVNIIMGN